MEGKTMKVKLLSGMITLIDFLNDKTMNWLDWLSELRKGIWKKWDCASNASAN